MPWIGHRKYVPDADERRRYGERQSAFNREQRQKYWTATRLKKARNWTDAAIKKYLGKVKTVTQPLGYNGETVHCWTLRQVEKAEVKPEFQEWMAKRVETQRKKQVKKGTDEWLESLKRLREEHADNLFSEAYHCEKRQIAHCFLSLYPHFAEPNCIGRGMPQAVIREINLLLGDASGKKE